MESKWLVMRISQIVAQMKIAAIATRNANIFIAIFVRLGDVMVKRLVTLFCFVLQISSTNPSFPITCCTYLLQFFELLKAQIHESIIRAIQAKFAVLHQKLGQQKSCSCYSAVSICQKISSEFSGMTINQEKD